MGKCSNPVINLGVQGEKKRLGPGTSTVPSYGKLVLGMTRTLFLEVRQKVRCDQNKADQMLRTFS